MIRRESAGAISEDKTGREPGESILGSGSLRDHAETLQRRQVDLSPYMLRMPPTSGRKKERIGNGRTNMCIRIMVGNTFRMDISAVTSTLQLKELYKMIKESEFTFIQCCFIKKLMHFLNV